VKNEPEEASLDVKASPDIGFVFTTSQSTEPGIVGRIGSWRLSVE